MSRLSSHLVVLAAILVGLCWADPAPLDVMEAMETGDECQDGAEVCALSAVQLRGQAKVGSLTADAVVEESQEDWGVASSCVSSSGCSRNDICQKIGNNGGKPLGGTIKCKTCSGSRKCQCWSGVGSAFTCGCTVLGLEQEGASTRAKEEA